MESSEVSNRQTIGYSLHGNRYLNINNRCTLRCAFCPKFNGEWVVQRYDLRLRREPTVSEILEAVGDPASYREVVFCGLGEPTLRLYELIKAARRIHGGGGRVRLNTDGLASLYYRRDITPDLEGNIDTLSVSLNAQDEATYNRHCHPKIESAYPAMLDFIKRVREFVPDITLTAIDGLPDVDIPACEQIARDLGVRFRRRKLDKVG